MSTPYCIAIIYPDLYKLFLNHTVAQRSSGVDPTPSPTYFGLKRCLVIGIRWLSRTQRKPLMHENMLKYCCRSVFPLSGVSASNVALLKKLNK